MAIVSDSPTNNAPSGPAVCPKCGVLDESKADLLAAAIRAVDALEWAENELDGEAPTSDTVRALRAAIAKATGHPEGADHA